MGNTVTIERSWKMALSSEFEKPYWNELTAYLRSEYASQIVYPPARSIFAALDACPLDRVTVLILGQDPYHGAGQAHGLSFSVPDGVRPPPSLQNIFKEISQNLHVKTLPSGNLLRWAEQGVLLLNSVLSVRAGQPASHVGRGWETFTDAIILAIAAQCDHCVFLLWGKYAQRKAAQIALIGGRDHLILESAHPSPFSATRFFGNHHFSQCNAYLVKHGKQPIDWR